MISGGAAAREREIEREMPLFLPSSAWEAAWVQWGNVMAKVARETSSTFGSPIPFMNAFSTALKPRTGLYLMSQSQVEVLESCLHNTRGSWALMAQLRTRPFHMCEPRDTSRRDKQ